MQTKKVKDFFQKVEGDSALQQKLKVVAENSDTQEAVAELVKIAEKAGFNFTPADYFEARKQAAQEFSESDLKVVTAGVSGCPVGYKCGLLIRF